MTADGLPEPALCLGTTSGELWVGHEAAHAGVNIRPPPAHEIYAVEVAALTPCERC
ncbi:MAG: hypothetical protein IPP50_13920 [Piscinibacter sp.]|nr:hypothetical protein [Piscinibacter sp.]